MQDQYQDEAKQRRGHTGAWQQSRQKTKNYTDADWNRIKDEASGIYKEFVRLMNEDVSSEPVRTLVKKWQQHISDNFYTCTDCILAGLGQMYTADPRFTENIDKHGKGLAGFMSRAIAAYCST